MKRLFKKYFQSVISPKEFDKFCNYVSQENNSESVFGLMETEWTDQLAKENCARENPILLQKIQQTILQQEANRATKKLNLYSIAVKIAAVLIVGMFVTSLWFYQQKKSAFENVPTQTVSIPYGAKTQFQLPDGSSVWLNSGSTLSYSGNFSKQRQVQLNGEAFFDIVKSKNPFTVQTNYGQVEVLGTAFNIQAFVDGEFTTTLERGMVKVVNDVNKQNVLMKPGEQVQLIQNKLVKSKVNTKLYTSWKEGKLIFARDPFPDIMKRLERWFNVKIEYSENDFEGLWFSGTIESETLTEVMNMICKAAPVKYTYNSQKREIKIEANKKPN